jgi:hypothetical protein
MENRVFQPSLFDDKEDFDPKHLVAKVKEANMDTELVSAAQCAYDSVTDYASGTQASVRLFADMFHERFFSEFMLRAYQTTSAVKYNFSSNIVGNERLYFTYGGYVFIFRKKDSSENKTKQNDAIHEQSSGMHVITINYHYDLDGIKNVSFQYIKGKNTVFSYDIPLCENENYKDFNKEQEIVAIKPVLKAKKDEAI